jgi:group I intron endonuclease
MADGLKNSFKDEIVSGVYKIENIKNKKVYIGSSKNILVRFSQHKKSLENNKHHSSKLQRSYNKSTDKSVFIFEILEIVKDEGDLKNREQYYIDLYDSFYKGYNCCEKVDNPKYSISNTKKSVKKGELSILYEKFWSLYNDDYIVLGRKLLKRLNDKHYKNITLKKLICAIEWFQSNYSVNDYKLRITYSDKDCWLTILDLNGNNFASYRLLRDVYFHKEATDFSINELIVEGKYNAEIHTPVLTEKYWKDKGEQNSENTSESVKYDK